MKELHKHHCTVFQRCSSLEHRGLCVSVCRVNVTKVNWNMRALADVQRSAVQLFLPPSFRRNSIMGTNSYSVSMPLKMLLVSKDMLLYPKSHSVFCIFAHTNACLKQHMHLNPNM